MLSLWLLIQCFNFHYVLTQKQWQSIQTILIQTLNYFFFFIFTLQCFWNQCNQKFSPCESLHYNVNQILYCTDLRQMIDLCFFWHFYANHCQIIYINLVVQWRTCSSALRLFYIPMIYVPLYRSLWGIIMSINQALTSEMIYNLRNVLCFG